jgi:all-trans-8'-apo-beta-carotenal 15,15'-oxygenase
VQRVAVTAAPPWDAVFGDAPEGSWLLDGAVPDELVGTLVRNGPGRATAGADPVHFFDACGLLAAVSFRGGRARLTTRHVRGPTFTTEAAAGGQRQRRIFTNRPGRWSNLLDTTLGNPAAHDVVAWAGRLLATQSAGHVGLDPATLDTLGPDAWGGAAPAGETVCPMPRVDPRRDVLVTWTATRSARGPDTLTFHALDPRWSVAHEAAIRLDTCGFGVHDLGFTDRWYLVTEVPSGLRTGRFLLGDVPFYDCLAWRPEPTVLHLAGRDRAAHRRVALPQPIRGAFHVVNAWDEGDDVLVELITGPDLPNAEAAYPPALRGARPPAPTTAPTGPRRVRVRPDDTCVVETDFGGVVGDLPAIDPRRAGRPHAATWLLSPGRSGGEPDPWQQLWRHALTRVDRDGATATWDAGPSTSLSPPAFAPVGDGEDGYVVAFALDLPTRGAEVIVLRAADPAAGPVARLPLGGFLAPASHARFFAGLAVGHPSGAPHAH